MAKSYFLWRWGLWWVVIGFLVLLQELFSLNFFIIALALVLVGITMPRTKRQAKWIWSVLEYFAYWVVFIVLFYGLIWLSKVFRFNTGLVLSVASLSIGIFLQIWAELLWQSGPSSMDALHQLMDRIRRL